MELNCCHYTEIQYPCHCLSQDFFQTYALVFYVPLWDQDDGLTGTLLHQVTLAEGGLYHPGSILPYLSTVTPPSSPPCSNWTNRIGDLQHLCTWESSSTQSGCRGLYSWYQMTVYIGIHMRSQEIVFGYTWKEVLCELPRICTLVYVHKDLTNQGLFNISGPRQVCHSWCVKIYRH